MATTTELEFDRTAYSVDAIQRAAYRLSDQLSIDVSVRESTISCRLYSGNDQPLDEDRLDALVAQFRNEVLDEVLRERIREETEEVRNVILSLAFSQTGLIEQPEEIERAEPSDQGHVVARA